MKKHLKGFLAALCDRHLMPTAIKVALIVGSILFVIDRASVLIEGKMTRQRWISGLLTYLVPYVVNIHGQYVSKLRERGKQSNVD